MSSQLTQSEGEATARVVRMAMPMPTMPKVLPWRAVRGLERPRSARMKSTPETR